MIHPSEYQTISGIPCVGVAQIAQRHTNDEFAKFTDWFTGKTGIMGAGGRLYVYASDYEKWLAAEKE